jgi:hypothetical protein
MARSVLSNKLFTEFQGQANPEWLPPYYLPPELNTLQKDFIEKNTERIHEHPSVQTIPTIPKVPPSGREPPEVKNIQTKPPHIQYVDNVEDVIQWTEPTFP